MWVDLAPDLDGHSNSSEALVVDTKEQTKDRDHGGVRDAGKLTQLLEQLAEEDA